MYRENLGVPDLGKQIIEARNESKNTSVIVWEIHVFVSTYWWLQVKWRCHTDASIFQKAFSFRN
jgi:hypothetical protein